MTQNEYQIALGKIYDRCAQDKVFRKRFIADPKTVIQEQGIDLPSHLKFKVVENQKPNALTLHLPPKPDQELSDEELESVAGGSSLSTMTSFMVQTTSTIASAIDAAVSVFAHSVGSPKK
ncbi:MAG: NHLP leader peptide family RiPP precursor [Opitutales bacterium]|nr:NHLP leader peptide family RiPP precursor [Opitutales bacterium]MCH8539643.1 NHLP leader peptide family RiPP precursor [Opitutales bacterium]